jgi:hypothetical protein
LRRCTQLSNIAKKTALRNGVGPTQTLVSSSVYVSS